MKSLDEDRLREDLRDLAEAVQITDVRDRVYATSRRMRRRRYAAASGSAALAAVVAFAFLQGLPSSDTSSGPVGPASPSHHKTSKTREPSVVSTTMTFVKKALPPGKTAFVPPTTTAGGRTSMPLALPDGSAVTLSYPAELELAERGFEPGRTIDASTRLGNTAECCRAVPRLVKGEYLGSLADGEGRERDLWNGKSSAGEDGTATYIQAGQWFVRLIQGMPDDKAWTTLEQVVGNFRFEETKAGFLMIRGQGPVKMRREDTPGENLWSGPKLASPPRRSEHDHGNPRSLEVARVDRCTADGQAPSPIELRGWQICRGRIAIRFYAEQRDQGWVSQLRTGLRVEHVQLTAS